MSELSIHDLETQAGELLPERETMAIIVGPLSNHLLAINGAEAPRPIGY